MRGERLLFVLIFALIFNFISVQAANAKTATTTSLATSLTPSIYGQSVTFTATVKPTPSNGELMTFYDGNAAIGTAALSSGTARLTTSKLSGGTHYITASYPGDSSLASSTSIPLTQTVRRVSVSTLLSSSVSTSSYGQPVTLTAKVPANIPNNETVTFYEGYSLLGFTSIISSSASLTVSTLTAGLHQVSATYSGDTNYSQSTSNTLPVTVKQAFTSTGLTSLTSSGGVTITATVQSQYAQVPDGETVVFKDGTSVINTSKLGSGVATFTASYLATGTHKITATYSGDANFVQSTSHTLTLVNGVATNVTGPACAFAINVSSGAPYYVAPQKISIYYTVRSLGGCTLSNAAGTLSLSGAATGEVYASLPINISNIAGTAVTRIASFNSTNATEGQNLAVAVISAGQASNLSTTSFYVLHTANVSIDGVGLSGGNTTQVGQPIYVLGGLFNNAFVSANNATINIKIVAPDLSVYRTSIQIGALRPFQNPNFLINPGLGAVPRISGRYLVEQNVSFFSNYSTTGASYFTNTIYSNTTTFQFTAYINKNSGYNASVGYPQPVSKIGPAIVESFPYYTEMLGGNLANLSSIAFYNSAAYPITVNLSVFAPSLGNIVLSHKSLALQPGQQGSTSLLGAPSNTTSRGTYLIPINVSVYGANVTTSKSLYSIITLKNKTEIPPRLRVLNRLTLLNGSTNSSTLLTILNPTNTTRYNVFMLTWINSSAAASPNSIAPNGPVAGFSQTKGAYAISWRMPILQAYNDSQFGYSISNLTQLKYALIPPFYLSSRTQSNLTILSILSIKGPQLGYVNNTYNVTVTAVYTGTNTTTIALTLTPSRGGYVLNPEQTFRAQPDSVISAKFIIKTSKYPGVETFRLNTPGISTISPQAISFNVQLPLVQVYTLYDYLSDPRTIFGILALVLYVVTLSYRTVSNMLRERRLKKRATVKSLAQMIKLDKKINVAMLQQDGRERAFRRQINKDRNIGGFVEESAEVGRDVIVSSTAVIEESPIISGSVKILDTARVGGYAIIRGRAVVGGNAVVREDAEIYGNAKISGNAKTFGDCEIYGDAEVSGNAEVFDDARIYGKARVAGNAKIYGSAVVSGEAHITKGNIGKGEHV